MPKIFDDEFPDEKERARLLWQRRKSKNRKGFRPVNIARKTFNEDMLDSSVNDGLDVIVEYRAGRRHVTFQGRLLKSIDQYFVSGSQDGRFYATDVVKFMTHFPNPDNLPMTIVVSKWE